MPARAKKKRASKKVARKKVAKKASPDHGARLHAMHNASSADYWMDCSLWYHLKVECERKGVSYDTDSEAARIGTLQHEVAEQAMVWYRAGKFNKNVRRCVDGAAKAAKIKLKEEKLADVAIALNAARALITDEHEVRLEVPIPLSHEPESTGPADFLAWREEETSPGQYLLSDVVLADYKFGRTKHSPNGYQLRVYASNALDVLVELGIKLQPDTRIRCAIIQPMHYTEAIVKSFTVKELRSFQAYVEYTVKRQKEGDRRGATSLSTCEWCDFDKLGICHHKQALVGGLLNSVRSAKDETLADETIEEIVRSRGTFKKVIEDCVSQVRDDPKRFPNWTRAEVSNGRGWSPLVDEEQIGHKLAKAGAVDLFSLRSPKQIEDASASLDEAEEVRTVVAEYSVENGSHVRLYFGAPDGSSKKEPKSRPNKAKESAKPKRGAAKKAARKSRKK